MVAVVASLLVEMEMMMQLVILELVEVRMEDQEVFAMIELVLALFLSLARFAETHLRRLNHTWQKNDLLTCHCGKKLLFFL